MSEVELLRAIIVTQRLIAEVGQQPHRVMALVADRAQRLSGAAGAVVELADGDHMVYEACSGSAASHVGMRIPTVGSLSGLCVEQGELLVCSDALSDDRVDRDACRRVGVRSMIVTPLIGSGACRGVLKVLSPHPQTFGPRDAELLQVLGGFIGTALHNAQTFVTARDAAHRDPLTGLLNRTGLDHGLQQLLAAAAELTVLFADLDGLKAVNDSFGHAVGDAALRHMGNVLVSCFRRDDLIARIGGDEFVVGAQALTERALDGALQRLHRALEQPLLVNGRPVTVKASVGSAQSRPADDVSSLLLRADEAMYLAKAATRQGARPSMSTVLP